MKDHLPADLRGNSVNNQQSSGGLV